MKRCILTLIACVVCWASSAQSIYRFLYWFDGNHNDCIIDTSSTGRWQQPLETSHLSEGFHTLFMQVQDSSGKWFSPQSHFFYRLPDTVSELPVFYTYWFDQDIVHQQRDSIVQGGSVLIDAGMLTTGLHTVSFQFTYGSTTSLKQYLFYKQPAVSSDSINYTCWIDQDVSNVRRGRALREQLIIDLDTFPYGIYTLNIQFDDGEHSMLKSFAFYKKPHAEIQIVRYEYWLNDSDSLKTIVPVSPQDTFTLMSLLQMPSLPIRSTYFHFSSNNGCPLVCAKNDIHFRFINGSDRYAQRSFTYVDYNVVDTIYADTLERDTTKVIASPRNNAIHWFKLAAGRGDSLSFHTDRPCTMQLYAPSGKMVFQSSGSNTLVWDGCHAWENGDYYLAVHDAEDTGTIAVSYQWIYRYAVLTWDVHRVGNGGLSTITFQGNGFNSLDTVYLIKASDTIPALYIGREKNTETSVFFNFENADTGMYQAVFMYEDEDLYKSSVVYVEEARPIVLTTSCSFPETFLKGGTVTYTYTITNTGNMTAYAVPLHVYIGTPSRSGISKVSVRGINLPTLLSNLDLDSVSQYERQWIIDWREQHGDDFCFERHIDVDSISGDSLFIRANYFFIQLAPYEIREVEFAIKAVDTVDVWVSIPDSVFVFKETSHTNTSSKSSEKDALCCALEIIECYINTKSLGASIVSSISTYLTRKGYKPAAAAALASTIAACVYDLLSYPMNEANRIVCSDDNTDTRSIIEIMKRMLLNATFNQVYNTVTDCLSIKLKSFILDVFSAFGDGFNIGTNVSNMPNIIPPGFEIVDCAISVFSSNPCCTNSCPPPSGGGSVPTVPVDPNDITGYLAESGSHAVGAEQMQLPYMIEFENDTSFATANAHTVVVRDTLDGRVFDLNSFKATSFSIGEDITPISGGQSFVRTVDMRPAINVIAQVQLDYSINTSFAVATWTFSSLDPMTLLPTTDPTQGFLPANYNGDGIGQVDFLINRKANLWDSALINNRAWIIFDNEAPIATSTWRNIMDITPPTSAIDTVIYGTSTAKVAMLANDNLSGVWRYHVYGQLGEIWLPLAMNIPVDSFAFIHVDTSLYTAFRTTAIDSAGNVEPMDSANDTAVYSVPLAVEAGAWYAISSPTHNTANNNETVAGVANLVSDTVSYDLFYYDESNATWRNYKVHSFDLEAGVGYVYRRSAADTLRFTGEPNTDSIAVTLTAGASNGDLRGFNLIGNPYPYEVIYGSPYYELRPNGTWYAHTSGVIDVAQGFLVHTTTPTTYTFTYPTPSEPDNAKGAERMPLAFTVAGNGYEDVVYVLFDEGEGLPKMGHLSADAPALSIDGKAIAMLGRETEEFPLTLRATPGDYALTAHPAQLYYLHLIDKATGADRDLLADSSYTFRHRGHGSDAERFVVRLAPAMHGAEGETFAYTDGTSIVVRGEGLLQVFDMLGRLVMTCEVDSERHIPVTHFHTGVYALRLAGKNQKIVVR